ncbi:MAG TPA: excinuclease ABC subunit UvrA [Terriglobales bacterium]|jgi:excinuclease ABC subunit A
MAVDSQRGAGLGHIGAPAGASLSGTRAAGTLEPAPVNDTVATAILVRGARLHNLKHIDVAIPLNAMTVVTGVSGSGKSSLAFDTLYAEGQRRYVESLSAYARQFLERMERPEVESIEGITPAVAIRQKAGSRNPRSTVATATEIYDYLRLLFARAGETWCPECGIPVERNDVDSVVTRVLAEAGGERCLVMFPVQVAEPAAVARGKTAKTAPPPPDAWTTRLGELRGKGFNRLWQSGKMVEFSAPESLLELDRTQPVFVLVDRLLIEPLESPLETKESGARARLVDAVEIAYRESGEVRLHFPDRQLSGDREWRFSERFECARCGRRFEAPEPVLFSFNNPRGACPRCQGFGNATEIAVERVIPDPGLSLAQGAIEPWTKPRGLKWRTALKRFAAAEDIPLDRPWRALSTEQQRRVWEGEGKYPGVVGFFEYLERKKYKVHVRVLLSRYRGYAQCPACHGARLRPEALAVWLRSNDGRGPQRACGARPAYARTGPGAPSPRPGAALPNRPGEPTGERRNIAGVTALTVAEAYAFAQRLALTPEQAAVASAVWLELRRRLEFLLKVGLDYITLDRIAATLSGGEAQRIQLATCLGSQLVGSLYVLDEPSIGLHPRDTQRLVGILHELRDLGNTIVVVEHDPDVMRASDHLIDLGPGAGEQGGRVVAAGTWQQVGAVPASMTGQYLTGARAIRVPSRRRTPGRRVLTIEGARAHNLKDIDVEIPLGLLVAVTGVSGSGKSSLVHNVLHRQLQRRLETSAASQAGDANEAGGEAEAVPECRSLSGAHHLSQVVMVDQSPIGRTPRSNPVTYLKAFDGIRELFARQPEARRRGYRPGHFSFNVPGGRCETCQGEGTVTVDMQFLADVELTCEECNGTRYQAGVLEVYCQGKNIHEVLQLTVREALAFFAGEAKILRPLRVLEEIGLGYLRLGQSATTLSGGEAQRIKLASHLAQPRSADRTLFLFDEPTTGLHFDDIATLLAALQRLIAAGGSVLVIEHNLEVIKAADWILELGPAAGAGGGRLIAEGSPEMIAASPDSVTAPFLAPLLAAPQLSPVPDLPHP